MSRVETLRRKHRQVQGTVSWAGLGAYVGVYVAVEMGREEGHLPPFSSLRP